MAETNMISLKVFLRDQNTTEARRFTIDASVVTSFIFMKEKLQTVFPNLRDTVFKITWKDADGDEITISSDEDIITAFTEMNISVKILFVTIVQYNVQAGLTREPDIYDHQFEGPRIICDVCNQVVTGFRYKCMQCPDYDLCSNCEHEEHHNNHLMIRVPNNDTYMTKCGRKFMHYVARNLKKSANAASKEAHKAAKIAHKFGGKCAGTHEDLLKQKEPAQPSCSSQTCQKPTLPFYSEDGITLSDVHALGVIARQHFAPILDVLRSAPNRNNPNETLFMDIICNAVDKFLEKIHEDAKIATTSNDLSAQSSVNQQNETNDTPMDIEGIIMNNTNHDLEQNKSNEQGWTYIINEPNPEAQLNDKNTELLSLPNFVQHTNPKIANGLMQLHEMGFSNEGGYLTTLLERHNGNVSVVVKAILDMNY